MSVKRASFSLRPNRRNEEFLIQKHCVVMLRAYMPSLEDAHVWWGASLSGVPLSPHLAVEAKKAGLERGALDVSFIFPDGRTKYIEVKTDEGVPTKEQAIILEMLGPSRGLICRSWDRGAPMKPIVTGWLGQYGLRLLTDRESVQREGARRQAEFAAMALKAKPLRRRVARAS